MIRVFAVASLVLASMAAIAKAQSVTFTFDNVPAMSPLPVNVTEGSITANLSATGEGFSIQELGTGTVGIMPAGFSGRCIFPSSIHTADLLVSFSKALTGFSIMFAPDELGCDDTATMRVTAYMNGSFVGTNTAQAPMPGTYPTGTLTFSSAQAFNSVVVHYDARPPTCQDYGVIFLADNMIVTPVPCSADFNKNGTTDVSDIFAFLRAWFPHLPSADVNYSGTVDVSDIFAFLRDWFSRC